MDAKQTTIYVIDDDPVFIELITHLLEELRFSVTSNCAAATSIPEICKQKPDLILSDLQMSEMDGLELCKEIRKNPLLDNSKFVFVSSHSGDFWKEKTRNAGGDGYIAKPVEPESFAAELERVLREAPYNVSRVGPAPDI